MLLYPAFTAHGRIVLLATAMEDIRICQLVLNLFFFIVFIWYEGSGTYQQDFNQTLQTLLQLTFLELSAPFNNIWSVHKNICKKLGLYKHLLYSTFILQPHLRLIYDKTRIVM